DAGAVRAAVQEVTGGHGTATARYVAKVARGFLRYLAVTGRCRPGLDAAILPVASWRRASLPRYVSADSVQRIIDACDATRPEGARDRAILLLLARLGLRGGDIVRLGVRDIDWAAARVRVVGKGRREVRLPLPQEVGDALLAYLRAGRASVACDRVFLRARAPWRPLATSSCVSAIVKRAMVRAAVAAPSRGQDKRGPLVNDAATSSGSRTSPAISTPRTVATRSRRPATFRAPGTGRCPTSTPRTKRAGSSRSPHASAPQGRYGRAP